MLVIGLSAENLRRMAQGLPASINTADLGLPPIRIGLVSGHTEDTITESLQKAGYLEHLAAIIVEGPAPGPDEYAAAERTIIERWPDLTRLAEPIATAAVDAAWAVRSGPQPATL